MNEWDLQKKLTKEWSNTGINVEGKNYDLICWELMFPSFRINNNKKLWNEKSIDFIFYSQENETFICCELKNKIKNKKELLSAYCQVVQRATLFSKHYSIEKINFARRECFQNDCLNRVEKIRELFDIGFSKYPKIKTLIVASSFPELYKINVKNWNVIQVEELKKELTYYKENMEFIRLMDLINTDSNLIKERNVDTLQFF